MSKRPWQPAPPDPGIKPGGVRHRAQQAAQARMPRSESEEERRRAQAFLAGDAGCDDGGKRNGNKVMWD